MAGRDNNRYQQNHMHSTKLGMDCIQDKEPNSHEAVGGKLKILGLTTKTPKEQVLPQPWPPKKPLTKNQTKEIAKREICKLTNNCIISHNVIHLNSFSTEAHLLNS
uniref:Uncharacterized protein n=1 Tax=Rhizophora mucronata TaxID=61149 RepID=A0A2P2NZ49_RHIMU